MIERSIREKRDATRILVAPFGHLRTSVRGDVSARGCDRLRASDHREQAVGASLAQVLIEPQLREERSRIERGELRGRLSVREEENERDEAAKRDRCLGRPGLITVPLPFPTRITRRLRNGRYVLLAFWGIRTDLPDPMPCYRILNSSGHVPPVRMAQPRKRNKTNDLS